MKIYRIPSLILAALLQVLPLARIAAVVQQPAAPLWAIIFRWAGAAAAALGGIEAVSGASTQITTSLNVKATNGIPFKVRLTTAPDQANYWIATGLPSGITLQGTSGKSFWQLAGTPTATGVFHLGLTAKDQIDSGSDRTVSATMLLTVLGTGTAPAITTQPLSQSVAAGATVTFTITASGTDPKSYQWKKNGQDLSGAIAETVTLTAVTTADSGSYTVLVSNSAGSILSSAATLTVTNAASPPSIRGNPVPLSVHAGEAASFSVTALGTPPLQYRWFFNGSEISGQTGPALLLSNVSISAAGDYSVQVSNAAGNITSTPATLSVNVLSLLSCLETSTATVLTWNGIAGETYVVEASDTPSGPWTSAGSFQPAVNNGVMTVSIERNGRSSQFFRVQDTR